MCRARHKAAVSASHAAHLPCSCKLQHPALNRSCATAGQPAPSHIISPHYNGDLRPQSRTPEGKKKIIKIPSPKLDAVLRTLLLSHTLHASRRITLPVPTPDPISVPRPTNQPRHHGPENLCHIQPGTPMLPAHTSLLLPPLLCPLPKHGCRSTKKTYLHGKSTASQRQRPAPPATHRARIAAGAYSACRYTYPPLALRTMAPKNARARGHAHMHAPAMRGASRSHPFLSIACARPCYNAPSSPAALRPGPAWLCSAQNLIPCASVAVILAGKGVFSQVYGGDAEHWMRRWRVPGAERSGLRKSADDL